MRLINEGCSDGGSAWIGPHCLLGPSVSLALGPGWHGEVRGAILTCPPSQLAHYHIGTSTVGQEGTAERWGGRWWDRDILRRGCGTLGESDDTPVSGKGRRPPSHPDLPLCSGSCTQSTDGKLRHGVRGRYNAHVPAAFTSPCQTCLVLPACPSPRRVPHPDSHARGHGQLSTSFQAGISQRWWGWTTVCRLAKLPQEGWGTPLPNPSLSGPQAAKPLSVPPRGCPPSLRPPSLAHGCLLIPPCLPSWDHPGDTAGDGGGGGAPGRMIHRRSEEGWG